MDGRRAQRQHRLSGNDLAHDEIGQVHSRRSHQDREQAHHVDRQHRPAPGKGLAGRIVHRQVDVAIGSGTGIDVGIQVAHHVHVRCIDPERGRGRERIVERRLATFLPPRRLHARDLHRQRPVVGDVLDHRVVPLFVRGLKGRDYDAVRHTQPRENHQDQDQDRPLGTLPHATAS